MRFWDTSALVPLFIEERATPAMRALLAQDPLILVWAATAVEVTSALSRRHRAGDLQEAARNAAESALQELEASWTLVADLGAVVQRARRLVAVHPLRAADALQLAAALVATSEHALRLPFVTLDEELAAAARREGFTVLPAPATP